MSVIITKMDMPNRCHDCGLKLRGTCPCLIKPVSVLQKTRLEDCPIKSVDGLINKIIEQGDLYTIGGGANGKSVKLGMEMAIEIIKEYCEVKV